MGYATISKQLKDNTLRLVVDVPAEYAAQALAIITSADTPIGFAVLDQSIKPDDESEPDDESDNVTSLHGKSMSLLYKSRVFTNLAVMKAFMTDEWYQAYCKSKKCAVAKHAKTPCEGDIVYAHVRRIADGAGTGVKPAYSGIPMCSRHHFLQHQHGESAVGGKDVANSLVVRYIEQAVHDRICENLGVDSLKKVSPDDIKILFAKKGLLNYLPNNF
jgi:hypothetical protein